MSRKTAIACLWATFTTECEEIAGSQAVCMKNKEQIVYARAAFGCAVSAEVTDQQ